MGSKCLCFSTVQNHRMFQLQMWVAIVLGDKLDLDRFQHAYHWNRNLTLLMFAAVDVDAAVVVVVVVGALGLVTEELKDRNHGM